MKFIMRNMIEKWIDYYSMFGETIPITSDYFLYNRIPEEAKDMDNHEIIHKFFKKHWIVISYLDTKKRKI